MQHQYPESRSLGAERDRINSFAGAPKRMDKENFDKELQARFPGNYHPFRSNGHPLNANIVYVGYNFSSSINNPFLDYWNKEHGYHYKAFQDQREADTKKLNDELKLKKAEIAAHNAKLPGRWHPTWIKTRHSSISSTRRNYIALTREIFGPKGIWVNTNIYRDTSSRQFQLRPRQKVVDEDNLVWLLRNCPEAIIVTYGNEACRVYEELRDRYPNLRPNIPSPHLTNMQIRKRDKQKVSGYQKLKQEIEKRRNSP
jgi:hypothetical protein